MQWIMGNCVTNSSRSQCTNENIQLIMWIFYWVSLLNTMQTSQWIVVQLDLSYHIDGNNNRRLNLIKICKDVLSSISMDDNNCHILISHLTFSIFSRYMISIQTINSYTINRKRHGVQPVEGEEGGNWNEGLIAEKYLLSKYTYDVMRS